MKETPSFEEVARRLMAQAGFVQKIVIGGLLSFVPVLNLLAFGYLYRYSQNLRRKGSFALPAWEDPKRLITEGLYFLAVWGAYWLLPLVLAGLLTWIFMVIGFGFFSYLIFGIVFAVAPALFSAALYRVQTRNQLADLLDVWIILRLGWMERGRFVIPCLAFAGIFFVAWPLYGLAFFVGFLLHITYTAVAFRLLESRAQQTPF